jgi:hypothetical protein
MSIMQLCKDWTSLHEIRKAVKKPKGDPLLRAVKELVKSGELEERGGRYGKDQYQVRKVQK